MERSVINVLFRHCRVTIDDERQRVETRFDDGAVVVATPNNDPESQLRSYDLGYGGSIEERLWQMTREHDLTHTLLAEAEGHPYSPTLHAVAHGYELAAGVAEREERVVLFVQRALHERRPLPEAVAEGAPSGTTHPADETDYDQLVRALIAALVREGVDTRLIELAVGDVLALRCGDSISGRSATVRRFAEAQADRLMSSGL